MRQMCCCSLSVRACRSVVAFECCRSAVSHFPEAESSWCHFMNSRDFHAQEGYMRLTWIWKWCAQWIDRNHIRITTIHRIHCVFTAKLLVCALSPIYEVYFRNSSSNALVVVLHALLLNLSENRIRNGIYIYIYHTRISIARNRFLVTLCKNEMTIFSAQFHRGPQCACRFSMCAKNFWFAPNTSIRCELIQMAMHDTHKWLAAWSRVQIEKQYEQIWGYFFWVS